MVDRNMFDRLYKAIPIFNICNRRLPIELGAISAPLTPRGTLQGPMQYNFIVRNLQIFELS